MEIPKVNGNGKNWLSKGLLQIVVILAMGLYILVDKVVTGPPDQSAMLTGMSDKVNINAGRILRLETLMESLREVPQDISTMKAVVDSVKSGVDKIERKLDNHIDKEK